jgi:uncharacterized membrane protein YjjP (DUF1212 family)
MQRAARALALPDVEFTVTPDAIYAIAFHGGKYCTQMVRTGEYGVNMWRLRAVEQFARELAREQSRFTSDELHERLRVIEQERVGYPRWLTVPVLAASCAAFCGVTGATALQMLAAFVGTATGHCLRLQLLKRHFPAVTIAVVCSFLACVAAYASSSALDHWARLSGLSVVRADKAVLASVLYLIPGVPLVTSLLDIAHGDCASGLSRGAHALLLVVCIGAGVLMFFAALGHGV